MGSSLASETQSTEIAISSTRNGNCHEENTDFQSQTGNTTQISSLKNSTKSLAVIESQLETMVVKSCHKPIFRKLVKLLMVPSFLFAGLRSGCIVGEMV